MDALNRTRQSVGSSSVLDDIATKETDRGGPAGGDLVTPDAPRQGGLPQGSSRSRPSLLRGLVLTATAAAMLACSLPVGDGGALADTAPVDQPQAEQTLEARPARGQIVSAPDASGNQGFWLTPLRGRDALDVQGQAVQRIWLAAVGSPEATGLQANMLGEVDLTRASGIKIAPTQDGFEAFATFAAEDRVMHATTIGLPRDVSGTVRLGIAPDAEPGGEAPADHLYLQLAEDAAVYLNGQRFTDVVHLGAATNTALQGLQPGMQADLGARLRSVETQDGPMAQLAAVIDLSTAGHEAGAAEPPFMKEGVFYSMDATALPVFTLSQDGERSEVLVIDDAAGRAYFGALDDAGTTFAGFSADYALTRHLAGGPTFELVDGAPTRDGRALERLGVPDAGTAAEKTGAWFRDGQTGEVFLLSVGEKDEVARAMASFTGPGAAQ